MSITNKFSIPDFGLGTWKIPKDKAENVVYETIKLGVRHIDCACDYGNEVEVGRGINKAITEGIVKREELFITSKLWNTYHAPQHVEPAARRSLQDLNITYFDLYLIHFPIALKYVPFDEKYPPEWIYDPQSVNPKLELEFIPYSETWKAMEHICKIGLSKYIGVSNLTVQGITEVYSHAEIKPVVNQVELHPYLCQNHLVEFCQSLNIQIVAFSPLGSSSYVELGAVIPTGQSVLEQSIIHQIAATHSKSPAQVILRWNIQRGNAVVTKSNHLDRINENFHIFDFVLTAIEMDAISALNKNQRFNDPGVFCRGMGRSLPIYE